MMKSKMVPIALSVFLALTVSSCAANTDPGNAATESTPTASASASASNEPVIDAYGAEVKSPEGLEAIAAFNSGATLRGVLSNGMFILGIDGDSPYPALVDKSGHNEPEWFTDLVKSEDALFVMGTNDKLILKGGGHPSGNSVGTLMRVDPDTGEIIWSIKDHQGSGYLISDTLIWDGNEATFLSMETGKKVFTPEPKNNEAPWPASMSPLILKYSGATTTDGDYHLVDEKTWKLTSLPETGNDLSDGTTSVNSTTESYLGDLELLMETSKLTMMKGSSELWSKRDSHSVEAMDEKNLLATDSNDGSVEIWDTLSGEVKVSTSLTELSEEQPEDPEIDFMDSKYLVVNADDLKMYKIFKIKG